MLTPWKFLVDGLLLARTRKKCGMVPSSWEKNKNQENLHCMRTNTSRIKGPEPTLLITNSTHDTETHFVTFWASVFIPIQYKMKGQHIKILCVEKIP